MIPITGVIFDLGGVVFESPIHRIADFERRNDLEPQAVARVIRANGDDGSWPRLERGELERGAFLEQFDAEFRRAGLTLDVEGLLAEIESALVVRPAMLQAIDRLRGSGIIVAALTNNWSPMSGLPVAEHFDVFVESFVEGCRKPDSEIYVRTLDRMRRQPAETAMLDDLGENLKTARSLGMSTHRVTEPEEAVRWLYALFGWSSAGLKAGRT